MKLLTKREAADILNVSERTLDRLRATGQIRVVRVRGAVRLSTAEIEKFIAKQTIRTGRHDG
jgi:excisionase family DNA binding protein